MTLGEVHLHGPSLQRRAWQLHRALWRAALVLVAFVASLSWNGPSWATEPPPLVAPPMDPTVQPPAGLIISVSPTLSQRGTFFQGWNSFSVRIQNDSKTPAKGTIQMRASTPRGREFAFTATAPYSVGEGSTHAVELPLRVLGHDVEATVFDELDRPIFRQTLNPRSGNYVVAVDLVENSPLRAWLDSRPITPTLVHPARMHPNAPTTLVLSARINPKTADPVLPDRIAGWHAADVVFVESDVLARVGDVEMLTLGRYVLGGGTLAIVIERPEDMRSEPLKTLLGGVVDRAAPPSEAVNPLPRPKSGGFGAAPAAPPGLRDVLAEELSGFRGGNLRDSPFGAVASYGLGEVVLLAFDPTKAPAVDDLWAQARIFELMRRAHDRRAMVAVRPGDRSAAGFGAGMPPQLDEIRRFLDPNEGARWAIGVAALFLCLYAIAAGPISYSRAAKKGRPLRAHVHLLVWSVCAFGVIVALGVATKGVRGRARHLALVEAGAGMSEGVTRRYRGLYASDAADLTSYEFVRGSVLSSALVDSELEIGDTFRVDRTGGRLVGVKALPWQTVVLREDGAHDLGQGITILPDGKDDALIVNKTGKDLVGVVVRLPGVSEGFFLERIPDGASSLASDGRTMDKNPDEQSWNRVTLGGRNAGTYQLHPLSASNLNSTFDAAESGLGSAWTAIEDAHRDVDWFPPEVPVLLGALVGKSDFESDSGLMLERTDTLVRVVGWGGTK